MGDVPSWYQLVRAVRYYNGAYTIHDLAHLPSAITQWALTAEAAEAESRLIAEQIAEQKRSLEQQKPASEDNTDEDTDEDGN